MNGMLVFELERKPRTRGFLVVVENLTYVRVLQPESCGSYKMHRPDGTSMPLSECPMAMAMKSGRSLWGADAIIERPDGTRRNVLANPQLVYDSTGALLGL